jgi:hypothetical protein
MTFLKKLFGRDTGPKKRVRICVECGMPIEQHKDWCPIHLTRQEMDRKRARAAAPAEP